MYLNRVSTLYKATMCCSFQILVKSNNVILTLKGKNMSVIYEFKIYFSVVQRCVYIYEKFIHKLLTQYFLFLRKYLQMLQLQCAKKILTHKYLQ